MFIFVPHWALIALVILAAVSLGLELYAAIRRRHHDHLIPDTPRSPRG